MSAVLGIAGFALITYAVNWEAALGLFLAIWGNNISINNGR